MNTHSWKASGMVRNGESKIALKLFLHHPVALCSDQPLEVDQATRRLDGVEVQPLETNQLDVAPLGVQRGIVLHIERRRRVEHLLLGLDERGTTVAEASHVVHLDLTDASEFDHVESERLVREVEVVGADVQVVPVRELTDVLRPSAVRLRDQHAGVVVDLVADAEDHGRSIRLGPDHDVVDPVQLATDAERGVLEPGRLLDLVTVGVARSHAVHRQNVEALTAIRAVQQVGTIEDVMLEEHEDVVLVVAAEHQGLVLGRIHCYPSRGCGLVYVVVCFV